MNAIAIAALSGIASGGVAYTLARAVHRRPADVAAYLAPVIGKEDDVAARERRVRRIMFDANRSALPNPESGEPARITRAQTKRSPAAPGSC